jgi:hypothetical protein
MRITDISGTGRQIMANDVKRPKAHPVVAKLAKAAKDDTVVALEGYVGDSEPSVIRLHPSPGVPDFTDIPEAAILHVEEEIDTRGRARVWVKGSATLEVMTMRRADAQMSGMSMARRAGGGAALGRAGGLGFFGDIMRCMQMYTAAYDHCLRTNPHVEHDITVCDQYAAEIFRQCMAGERPTSPF